MLDVKVALPPVAVNPFEVQFIKRSEKMSAAQQLWGFSQDEAMPGAEKQAAPDEPLDVGKKPLFSGTVAQYLVGLGLLGAVAGLVWWQGR